MTGRISSMKPHKMEILAPAGDWDMLRAAVFSGADCVYLGLRGFNARGGAANFAGDELARAVGFCHARNCKVYAAANTLALPGEEEELARALACARRAGCDAVIVQDLNTLRLARAAGLCVHASTQMSVHSLAGVRALAGLGVARVILARELSLAEIGEIAAASPIELEVFVHGALCVSVSGQCYASAFLGGRSANRGACAGPCRLPFAARPCAPRNLEALAAALAETAAARTQGEYDLSLKDLSILDALPALEKLGVRAAKIEGRLRGPEYCAVAVDSARKAINGEDYNKELLLNVFSREGFTDGWFSGKNGGDMFGVRSPADAAATKRALPKARALYRREMPRVPVQMCLSANATGGELTVTDGAHQVVERLGGPFALAGQNGADRLRQALVKTGGTPFYCEEIPEIILLNVYISPTMAAEARRHALEGLLALRETLPVEMAALAMCGPVKTDSSKIYNEDYNKEKIQTVKNMAAAAGQPRLRARFEHVAQMPHSAAELCETLLLPLLEAGQVPEKLRTQTVLWLPRVLFGRAEKQTEAAIAATAEQGFAGYEANNLAHLHLLQGQAVSGGFGLNATSAGAVRELALLGCAQLTLSPELSLPQMRALAGDERLSGGPATDALCYGHLPLFLTRACPLRHGTSCANCPKAGYLLDRKGRQLPLLCRDGARSVYNPVPLWMEAARLPTSTATLYFTIESRAQAAAVLADFAAGRPAGGPFTRGLYSQGTKAL